MFAEENGLKGDPRLRVISESIRVIPNFPKPGIMFQDISTLLLNHKAFKHTEDVKNMAEQFLEYVMENHHITREPVALLHAFQLSVKSEGSLSSIKESNDEKSRWKCLILSFVN
ncbi:unnamed protein product [Rhodiola kirilowii]